MPAERGVAENEPLAPLTSFRIGGPARWFARPKTLAGVRDALDFSEREGSPPLFLGGGNNLLVADAGVDGLVVRLDPGGDFGRIEQDADDPLVWRVGAAASFPKLVADTLRRGVSGLEEFAGIPGSVGGAAAMNAGSARRGLGGFVRSALVSGADGATRRIAAEDMEFRYRGSSLAGSLALEFEFRFASLEPPAELLDRARRVREEKVRNQPLDQPSAGCIFKNPAGDSAGMLLDAAGSKGMREGGAAVSDRHANFIVNVGDATAYEVAALAARMRNAVRARFGVELEPEVRCWGFELSACFS
ncbi:MAG: UDP-N-acetylmuramate dehydrogenase [Planctomycetota bacterium]|jgi:UDP-N-acetylmuramate dehydrogenase|nr:UDP-N-acetylmuramate dehydrogenase [Planctomycetota bacterium]